MLSRSAKIILLLTIDVVFLFIELITGYTVGSLALVADSFHMLNDVMSLVVALYAIRLTAKTSNDSRYTYGWHRAEILAALINGVFLLALCLSISLEAIERFFSVPEISNPRLIVVVGVCGLASNVVGLFLFHEHSHSHEPSLADSASTIVPSQDPTSHSVPRQTSSTHFVSRSRTGSYSSLYGHPAATRASLVQAANDMASQARSPSPTSRRKNRRNSVHSRHSRDPDPVSYDHDESTPFVPAGDHERTPLLDGRVLYNNHIDTRSVTPSSIEDGRHRHSHSGSMNMRALLLHVLGDALGNIGVIATGLVILLTEWSFKYYFDPVISVVIAAIIFSSALPLVRSASFILLQGVPATVSIEEVRKSILNVEGVLSLHELHIWQLSETKIVASVHVTASRNHDFMLVASNIRKALHHQGIHSSTIQPEYHNSRSPLPESLKTSGDTGCLIPCPSDRQCNPSENACCPF